MHGGNGETLYFETTPQLFKIILLCGRQGLPQGFQTCPGEIRQRMLLRGTDDDHESGKWRRNQAQARAERR